MKARIGNVAYWAGWFVAAGIVLNSTASLERQINYIAIAIAAGWALRYILTGKKTIKP